MQAQISVLIDYAHEPESLSLFLQTLQGWKKSGYFDVLVHVLSCDGVGRDDWKKPIMGQLSYKYADFTILTTDNYGPLDDPQAILALLGKNFLHKNEQLTQEWLDDLTKKIESLGPNTNLENITNKPKVKFLLEVNRRKALDKALKVGLFLAQNYDFLDLKYTSDLPSLSKNPKKLNQLGIDKQTNPEMNNDSNEVNLKPEKIDQTLDLEKLENLNQSLPSNTCTNSVQDKPIVGEFSQNQFNELSNQNISQGISSQPILNQVKLEVDVLSQILAEDYDYTDQTNGLLSNQELTPTDHSIENLPNQKNNQKLNINSPKNTQLSQHIAESNLDQLNLPKTDSSSKQIKVLVFSTGVGCEPFLSQPEGPLAWSERQIWQQLWQEFINVEMFNQKLAQKFAQSTLE